MLSKKGKLWNFHYFTTCDVKNCVDNSDQVLVVHHCEMLESTESKSQTKLLCKFNPYEVEEDELDCVIRICDKHADNFRRLERSGNLEKSTIQFKDSRHKHKHW
jgi:hypothetical protein